MFDTRVTKQTYFLNNIFIADINARGNSNICNWYLDNYKLILLQMTIEEMFSIKGCSLNFSFSLEVVKFIVKKKMRSIILLIIGMCIELVLFLYSNSNLHISGDRDHNVNNTHITECD